MAWMDFHRRYLQLLGWILLCVALVFFKMYQMRPAQTKVANVPLSEDQLQNFKMQEQRHSNISFLKVPKCGSSTMSCLLIRYGLKYNLSTYLPRTPMIRGSQQNILIHGNYKYNIFAVHTHYNYEFFTHIVDNPIIIGQIRQPERRIISQAFYNMRGRKGLKVLPPQAFINEVAEHTEKYQQWNQMSKFFGISNKIKSNTSEFKEILNKLDQEFHLVLILERFDESLILLKRMLHCTIADIIYSKKKDNSLTTGSMRLSKHSRQIFQQSNKKDYVLYDFFSKKLNQKIIAAGKDLQDEVLHFKTVCKQAESFCINGTDNILRFPPSKWDDTFILSKQDCNLITQMNMFRFRKESLLKYSE